MGVEGLVSGGADPLGSTGPSPQPLTSFPRAALAISLYTVCSWLTELLLRIPGHSSLSHMDLSRTRTRARTRTRTSQPERGRRDAARAGLTEAQDQGRGSGEMKAGRERQWWPQLLKELNY